MRKFTKVLGVVLALVLVVTMFASCGGKKSSGKIVIGGTGPLTGKAATYGNAVKNGAQMAVDEINAAGGLNGIELQLNFKDDKADPQEAATAYDQLMDEGMQISIGSTTSGSCESFAQKAQADNVLFITPSGSMASIIAERSNGFRICFSDPQQGELAAQKIAKEYAGKKIGCIYNTSDPYSSGIYDAFKAEMDKLNTAFSTQTFNDENDKDFSAQAEALKDCDIVFLPFYYEAAGLVARAFTAKGSQAYLFGSDGLDGVADQVDSSVKNKISYITPLDINSKEEKVVKFVNDYKAKFGETPIQFAADAYDAVYVLFEAMKAAGVDSADISASDLCNKVAAQLTGGLSVAGITGTMTWDNTGAPIKELKIAEVTTTGAAQ